MKSTKLWAYTDKPRACVYIPWATWEKLCYADSIGEIIVRSTGDPSVLVPAIRQVIGALDSRLPVSDVVKLEDRLRDSTSRKRLYMQLLSIFAMLGLVLASVGLYGVVSYSVTQRTHEIGLRMALGARQNNVLRFVVQKGLLLIVIGLFVGLAGALAITHVLSSLLYDVTATDPWTLMAVSLLLATVGGVACYIPARRAVKIDPMEALRYE
ncbi:MAG: FtsX-like permease family protein [Sedimentisphaerales bacterium]|nr:FtsX-like permease family protein [Sedimentisphaerales bacterium]